MRETVQDSDKRRRTRRKPQTTRVSFFGVTFEVSDSEDPDDVIERYVASGQHKLLEEVDPQTAVMLTERFVTHQKWLESQTPKKKDRNG